MDTKVMYFTAVVIASVAGAYYYYSGSGQKLETLDARNVSFTAKQIKLTQTEDNGELELTADVDELTQWMQTKEAKLTHLNVQMYDQGKVNSTFWAKQAHGYDDNARVVLSGEVVAKRWSDSGVIQFETEKLTGFPKRNYVETDVPVNVTTPQANFVSDGLKADLVDGQYEFFNIRGNYAPRS